MTGWILKSALAGFAVMHLMFVTLSASYIEIADWMPGKNIFDFYLKASGADSSYGFFAPSIGLKSRAFFDIIDEKGTKFTDIPLTSHVGREVEIRLGGIYDEFTGKEADDAEFRQPLAASLAAKIFSQNPNAKQVVFRIEKFLQTTMEEYLHGERPLWSAYYAARFIRHHEKNGDL